MKNANITYGVKRLKYNTIEVNGKFVYKYRWETTLDCRIFDTEQEAKNHIAELKKDISKNWKNLRQAVKNGTMYYNVYTEKDGNTYGIVADLRTNKADCRYIRQNTPEVTKLVLTDCYKYVRGL
jgi:hypothetical protein